MPLNSTPKQLGYQKAKKQNARAQSIPAEGLRPDRDSGRAVAHQCNGSNLVYQTRLELQIQQRVNSLTALRGTARGAVHQFASFMGIHVEETSNGPALEWWADDTALRPIDSESGTTVIVSGEEHLVTNGEQVAATDDRDDPNLEENSTGSGLADAESRLNINVATPEQFMAFPGRDSGSI